MNIKKLTKKQSGGGVADKEAPPPKKKVVPPSPQLASISSQSPKSPLQYSDHELGEFWNQLEQNKNSTLSRSYFNTSEIPETEITRIRYKGFS